MKKEITKTEFIDAMIKEYSYYALNAMCDYLNENENYELCYGDIKIQFTEYEDIDEYNKYNDTNYAEPEDIELQDYETLIKFDKIEYGRMKYISGSFLIQDLSNF